MSSGKHIVFTGGSGKACRHVIPELLKAGHSVLNLDLKPLPNPDGQGINPDVYTITTDLTDSGQVFNALSSHPSKSGYMGATLAKPPDVVIHFAAYARNGIVPDNTTFQSNITSTYNVVEAACKLGVKKIIIASSETTYGICFSQDDIDPDQFPMDEDDHVVPEDSYALSKICGERVAATFARRHGVDIYALRIGQVIEPPEYQKYFPQWISHPETRKRNCWSYMDARDLGQICRLCMEKDGLGFQIFNATNDTITTTEPTAEVLKKHVPNAKITREMGEYEAPLSNKKIRDVLGFKEEHNWRKYYQP